MSFSQFLTIALLAMLPITEIQGAIPFFLATRPDLPALFILISAVTGAMVPPALLLKLLPIVTNRLHDYLHFKPESRLRFVQQTMDWFYHRIHQKHSKAFERFGALALILITGIPLALPGSGVWTGSVLAFLFQIPYQRALLFMFLGTLFSGMILTGLWNTLF